MHVPIKTVHTQYSLQSDPQVSDVYAADKPVLKVGLNFWNHAHN